MTFADTSALLATLDADERAHEACATTWRALLDGDEPLMTTSYTPVEIYALTQRRLGLDAVRALSADLLPLVEVVWIDAATHDAAVGALLAAARRRLSLVDCAGFEVMRRRGVSQAFTLDAHFAERGFRCLPVRA